MVIQLSAQFEIQ